MSKPNSSRHDPVHLIPFARPCLSDAERNAVLKVLEGHVLTHGPECKAFEQEFGGFLGQQARPCDAHCVTVSSCMAALHLSYIHFGLSAGDEVIVPALTHVATAHAVEWVGAHPVFVDCDKKTGNITAEAIEKALTPRTRAISVVHFVGIPCEMDKIVTLAERHDLRIIEDCALAVGALWKGRHVGLHGDSGCFSFYPVKHLTTGEGGMFVSRHESVAREAGYLRAFGVDRTHSERQLPGNYDVPRLGLNYRMSEMQAALGRVQTSRLPDFLAARRKNFEAWKLALSSLEEVSILDSVSSEGQNSFYCLVVRLEGRLNRERNAIVQKLQERGVGTSVYYPQPVPRMTYYRKKYGYDATRYPNAEAISDCSIALPVGPHIHEEHMDIMTKEFTRILKGLA